MRGTPGDFATMRHYAAPPHLEGTAQCVIDYGIGAERSVLIVIVVVIVEVEIVEVVEIVVLVVVVLIVVKDNEWGRDVVGIEKCVVVILKGERETFGGNVELIFILAIRGGDDIEVALKGSDQCGQCGARIFRVHATKIPRNPRKR